MSNLLWFFVSGIVCFATLAASSSYGTKRASELGPNSKTTHYELVDFNVGEFQGLMYGTNGINHFDNSSISPAVLNGSSDVMFGEFNIVLRNSKAPKMAAQNYTLASYNLTHSKRANDCHDFDFNLNLVSIIKLHGHVQVCTGSNGYWSLTSKPCIAVFGFDLGCTEINLSSDNVKYCWNVNVALAKASVCAVVENSCLSFNGDGCYYSFPGWSCKDFDAQAFCW